MNTWLGRAAVAAIVALGAARADAQITTVVATPKRTQAEQQEIARRGEAAQDSLARVTLTGMKQWVDSAATALALRPDTGTTPPGGDTAATAVQGAPTSPRRDSTVAGQRRGTPASTEFRDGVRAPDTATPFPSLALAGAAMVVAGMALRRRRPTAVKSRARRRRV